MDAWQTLNRKCQSLGYGPKNSGLLHYFARFTGKSFSGMERSPKSIQENVVPFCFSREKQSLQANIEIQDNWVDNPASIYLLKVNNRKTRTRCEIFSKLIIKTPEWRQCRRSGGFIVNIENISYFFVVFLLLNLNM